MQDDSNSLNLNNTVLMAQVHGNNIHIVSKKDAGKTIPECDGLITTDTSITLGVRVADCLAVSFVDNKNKIVGIFHAGWRGLHKKILEKAVDIFIKEYKRNPKSLSVYIGPHLCVNHMEIKSDVSEKFEYYKKGVLFKSGRMYLNMSKIAVDQMTSKGLDLKNIKVDSRCTFEDHSLPSFRRDKTGSRFYLSASLDGWLKS